MRIVGGKYGGRRLEVPVGRDIRPTGDKIRGAIFNALEARGFVHGARVLDCFCGTGALGLEALSRGADFCSFWDKDRRSLELTQRNASTLNVLDHCEFILRDTVRSGYEENHHKYDLFFIDAPYRKDFLGIVLKRFLECSFIAENGVVVLEAEKEFDFQMSGSFSVLYDKIYADTKVLFLLYQSS